MSVARLVDTHAHVMDQPFDGDLEAVLARAAEEGVSRLVCPGLDAPTSRAAIMLAEAHAPVWAAVGIHPNDVEKADEAQFEEIARLASHPSVVGIGETGLDYYRTHSSPVKQRDALEWHAHLAEERGLPLLLHNRDADGDVLQVLEASAGRRKGSEVPAVLHCFSSLDTGFLTRVLDAGCFISFAGPITFKANSALREMACRVPPDRLLVETDCPYLAPEPFRGRRNEPAYVRFTAERLADVRGVSPEDLAEQMWRNACVVFPAFEETEFLAGAGR